MPVIRSEGELRWFEEVWEDLQLAMMLVWFKLFVFKFEDTIWEKGVENVCAVWPKKDD